MSAETETQAAKGRSRAEIGELCWRRCAREGSDQPGTQEEVGFLPWRSGGSRLPTGTRLGQNVEVLANAWVLTGEGWSRAVKGQELLTLVLWDSTTSVQLSQCRDCSQQCFSSLQTPVSWHDAEVGKASSSSHRRSASWGSADHRREVTQPRAPDASARSVLVLNVQEAPACVVGGNWEDREIRPQPLSSSLTLCDAPRGRNCRQLVGRKLGGGVVCVGSGPVGGK